MDHDSSPARQPTRRRSRNSGQAAACLGAPLVTMLLLLPKLTMARPPQTVTEDSFIEGKTTACRTTDGRADLSQSFENLAWPMNE
mmetsp:Transcript_22305/g.35881  ORF Transcript_22305/g.35881 Transcript_22305/m.35881 type:complete len:85 (-) Transcript_22305:135-389(-)